MHACLVMPMSSQPIATNAIAASSSMIMLVQNRGGTSFSFSDMMMQTATATVST